MGFTGSLNHYGNMGWATGGRVRQYQATPMPAHYICLSKE